MPRYLCLRRFGGRRENPCLHCTLTLVVKGDGLYTDDRLTKDCGLLKINGFFVLMNLLDRVLTIFWFEVTYKLSYR